MSELGEYVTPARLKSERFWTDKLIKDHLGDPDHLATNPNYRSGPEMRLYEVKRVLRVEKRKKVSALLINIKERRAVRSLAMRKSADTRRKSLIKDELAEIETNFDGIALLSLMKMGMEDKDIYGSVDTDTKHRWAVNFARHQLTTYDGVRYTNSGRVGVHAAAEAVRNEVLGRIAKTWPDLSDECQRQRR